MSEPAATMTPNEFGWPVWTPVPGRYPWRLMNAEGELWRHPPEGRVHRAMVFQTPQQALRYRDREYAKLQRRKKNGEVETVER